MALKGILQHQLSLLYKAGSKLDKKKNKINSETPLIRATKGPQDIRIVAHKQADVKVKTRANSMTGAH